MRSIDYWEATLLNFKLFASLVPLVAMVTVSGTVFPEVRSDWL